MRKIHSEQVPRAIGPYSQGIMVDKFLYSSGQIPVNAETNTIDALDIVGQAHQVCKNIGALLKSAGMTYDDVIKTTCYLSDITNFEVFNEVYSGYFISKPARSCVEVSALPKGSLVLIDIVAYRN